MKMGWCIISWKRDICVRCAVIQLTEWLCSKPFEWRVEQSKREWSPYLPIRCGVKPNFLSVQLCPVGADILWADCHRSLVEYDAIDSCWSSSCPIMSKRRKMLKKWFCEQIKDGTTTLYELLSLYQTSVIIDNYMEILMRQSFFWG